MNSKRTYQNPFTDATPPQSLGAAVRSETDEGAAEETESGGGGSAGTAKTDVRRAPLPFAQTVALRASLVLPSAGARLTGLRPARVESEHLLVVRGQSQQTGLQQMQVRQAARRVRETRFRF